MNLRIKSTTGIVLEGNKLSGNTYPVKDWIKSYLGGKFDGASKSWIVDTSKVNDLLSKGANIYADNSQPQAATKTTGNGYCRKCHSYCYGDCEAN